MMHFGDVLKRLLDARGLTISRWARIVGIAQGFASNIVAGRRTPPLDTIDSWADSLHLTGNERAHFIDVAAVAHLPKQSQARFLEVIEERARMQAAILGLAHPAPPTDLAVPSQAGSPGKAPVSRSHSRA